MVSARLVFVCYREKDRVADARHMLMSGERDQVLASYLGLVDVLLI